MTTPAPDVAPTTKKSGRPWGAKDRTPAERAAMLRKRSRKRGPPLTPALEDGLGAMLGSGVTQRQAADAYGVTPLTVSHWAQNPHVQEKMQAIRTALREINLTGLHAHTAQSYDLLGEMVRTGDTQGFQQVANGIAHMERTAASASGEARRIEQLSVGISAQADQATTAEAVLLLRAILG